MAIAVTATAAILFVGSLGWKADAQTTRGAAAISATAKNFTPIDKGCLRPVLGPLVRALSSPGVRSLSMLVCSLLILKGTPTGVATIKRRGRLSWRPRHFRLSAAFSA
jgi:hypothetical protein